MGYGVKFKVWGDYACFSRPELKVERVSYDMITPSAARGLIESVYWKPAIIWTIDKIHVINPIKFTNIRRNEVKQVARLNRIKKTAETKEPYYIESNKCRHQRAAMVLTNVMYVIEAHFELNKENAGETDTIEKHYNIALRRLRNGQYFSKPCLGTREFGAEFAILEDGEMPKSALHGEMDLGYMLYDIGYSLNEKKDRIAVDPKFFRAKLIDGVLDLTTDVEVVE
ncbi:MAG: type I-C CRISPR-associated protein Cas5c [Christensenellaceae bacterium]